MQFCTVSNTRETLTHFPEGRTPHEGAWKSLLSKLMGFLVLQILEEESLLMCIFELLVAIIVFSIILMRESGDMGERKMGKREERGRGYNNPIFKNYVNF